MILLSFFSGNSTEDQNCKDSSSSNSITYLIPTIIGLIVGIALITILLLWIAFKLCHCSSRSRADQKPDAEEASHCTDPIQPGYANQLSQNYHQNTLLMRPRAAFISLDSTAPTGTFPRNLKTKNFLKMSPKQRIQALEFPHERICIMKDQEGSSFGPTYIGEATGLHENEPTTTVFIKSLRNGATEDIKRQFNAEMIWVSSYSHQNVLPLLAICNKEEPHYMVYEYLEFGTLKHFLCNLDSVWMDFDDFLNEESSMAPSTTTASALGNEWACTLLIVTIHG